MGKKGFAVPCIFSLTFWPLVRKFWGLVVKSADEAVLWWAGRSGAKIAFVNEGLPYRLKEEPAAGAQKKVKFIRQLIAEVIFIYGYYFLLFTIFYFLTQG